MARTVAICQARLGSMRFPRKVLADVGGVPAVGRLLNNLATCKRLDDIVLAVPYGDRELIDLADKMGVNCFAGSENDVLSRYVGAAVVSDAETIVRITADCPLTDPALVDAAVDYYCGEDYLWIQGYPKGVGDIEVMSYGALAWAHRKATEPSDREHVVNWTIRNGVAKRPLCPSHLYRPDYRVCLDEPSDLAAIRHVLFVLDYPRTPTVEQVVEVLDTFPEIRDLNRAVVQVS